MRISANIDCEVRESEAIFRIREEKQGFALRLDFAFDADGEEYILFPACAYNGNRFAALKKPYPPMFTPSEAAVDMPVTITDVPRLETDGSGCIEVTTGDVSTPCIGVYSAVRGKGVLLFTTQGLEENFGLSYTCGKLSISYPHMRSRVYRGNSMRDIADTGRDFAVGEEIRIPYRLLEFDCTSLQQFYRIFFENRKIMGLDDTHAPRFDIAAVWKMQEDKFNTYNWRESLGAYGVGVGEKPNDVWQPGWIGGAISSYPLLKYGSAQSKARAVQTLDFLFSTQTAAGFFESLANEQREYFGDGFGVLGTERWHLVRKSADVLYYLFRQFALLEQVPKAYEAGAKKLADAFVTLWKRYGQFGQFVHVDSGDIAAGGTTSAGIAPAGLVAAWQYFGEPSYLDIAKRAAELYYKRDVEHGYTTGGPGEILQGPDSESAFGLLESMIALYEATGQEQWLEWARDVAHLCASWVVSYNYRFRAGSEFARLDKKSIGSVFANVQNKHAAPGICTLSGEGLLKLYQYTGDSLYLELLADIAWNIAQYLSTDTQPLHTRGGDRLPQGYMNERVNLSDWEGEEMIGGLYGSSCWCETSNLLTMAELLMDDERRGLLCKTFQ